MNRTPLDIETDYLKYKTQVFDNNLKRISKNRAILLASFLDAENPIKIAKSNKLQLNKIKKQIADIPELTIVEILSFKNISFEVYFLHTEILSFLNDYSNIIIQEYQSKDSTLYLGINLNSTLKYYEIILEYVIVTFYDYAKDTLKYNEEELNCIQYVDKNGFFTLNNSDRRILKEYVNKCTNYYLA